MRTETEGSETPAGTCGWLTFKSTLGQINGGQTSLFKDFIYFIFRQRGREGERERDINVWLPLARPLLGT